MVLPGARTAGRYGLILLWWGLVGAGTAAAHGFGQRFDLPVPLWLYTVGAALTVVVSFVIVGVFVRGASTARPARRFDLLQTRAGRMLAHPLVIRVVRATAVLLFIALIAAGLFGRQSPTKNLAPTLIWVIWWVGVAYVSALVGNLWAVINPLAILFEWGERLYRHMTGRVLSLHVSYPKALGAWPALALYLAFAWVELVSEIGAVPSALAWLVLLYAVITWAGMYVFGKDVWLRYGEAFSLVFGLLARFAPMAVQVTASEVCETCRISCRDRDGDCIDCHDCFARAAPEQRAWILRPYAAGLFRNERVSASEMVFVLVLLATVTFDGFMATPLWVDIEAIFRSFLAGLGAGSTPFIRTIGLVVFVFVFLEIYLLFSALMALTSGQRQSAINLALVFTFSLVPIAIAYHVAHYLSFLLIQGQRLIPLLSDPFGWGWNLFGTASYRVNIGVIGAEFGWYTAVVTIVVGHIIAVYLAHLVAIRTLRDHVLALRSQYPMLVLMVGYTVISLWILAQPAVEGGESSASVKPPPAAVAFPAMTMQPARPANTREG